MKNLIIDEFLQPISAETVARGSSSISSLPSSENSLSSSAYPAPTSRECGIYLKYDYTYDQLRELRREDDPQLTQGVWLIEPKKAAWNDVEKLCESLLKNTTKDLQIAMWLLEAKTVMYGLPGLNQGLQLVHALCERFWEEIWPDIGSGGNMTARVSPFYFFAEKVADRILGIPMTAPQDGISEALCLSDWVTARHNLRMKNPEGITLDDFQKSIGSTATAFMADIDGSVRNSLENLAKLETFLNSKCEHDAPSFRNVYDNLNEIKQVNGKYFEERRKADAEAEAKRKAKIEAEEAERKALEAAAEASISGATAAGGAGGEGDSAAKGDGAGGGGGTGAGNGNGSGGGAASGGEQAPTIEEAYRALNDIAAFLEQQQPQSPSSILIRIAGSIGKKTFKELMNIETNNGITLLKTIAELYRILRESEDSGAGDGDGGAAGTTTTNTAGSDGGKGGNGGGNGGGGENGGGSGGSGSGN